MKRLLLLSLLITISLFPNSSLAQNYRKDSNSVTTKVGTPTGNITSCLIPNGTVTCGSKNVPVNGCGHCGVGYETYMANCTYPGIYFAMDIGGVDFQNIILPSINGTIITWTFVEEPPKNKTVNQAIQLYAGTNTSSGEKYWLQLHHTQPGSAPAGTFSSGDVGAKICGNGCSMGHVHLEFAKVDPSGENIWQDAPNYFCK